MERVLVDSSVWVDYFNGSEGRHVELLANALSQAEVCVCSPIIQEVLQGIRNDSDHLRTKRYILDLKILEADPLLVAIESAELYRFLRRKGVTIRKSNDCVIAWFAMRFGVKLLQCDRDFRTIAAHTMLELFE